MMKFDFINEVATVDGMAVQTGHYENATWVSDTEGMYAIKSIDWQNKRCEVAEICFEDEDSDNYYVADEYTRTFDDMKGCTL